ncbi:hypothetical protein EU534_02135 [Candidatus Heimdallarchaeota archaeon]|nr:MAG: hypothetical protein EU534_02135 [Candidatus Heimdallarchaeota archaeon]
MMRRVERFVVFWIGLFLLTPQIVHVSQAATRYEIDAMSNVLIEFSEDVSSLFIVEVDNSETEKPYNVTVTNQFDLIEASRVNYTNNLVLSFIGTGDFALTIGNPNSHTLGISVTIESFNLVINNEIGGFSHKNKIYCWSFNTGSIVDYKSFFIESIKRGYFNLYYSIGEEDLQAHVWLSQLNPSSDSGWNDYLESISLEKNSKRLINLEEDNLWLVLDIDTLDNLEVVIVLQSTIPGRVVIIIVGISAAVVGVIVFVLYYYDPLKYRKRKVEGKEYDSVKHEFEYPEDIGDTIAEIITKTKKKK